MLLHADKFALVAGEYLSSGEPLRLPVNGLWPELLVWHDNAWIRTPAEGINVFKLMRLADEKNYKSPFWLTLRDGELAGGKLKLGAEGSTVAAWRWSPKEAGWEGDISPDNVQPEAALEGEDEGELAVAMRPKVVFNADEWEGLENWPGFIERHLPSREEVLERAEQIERLGAGCEIKHGGAVGFYNPSLNYISLPARESFKSPKDYYWTLFEQIGHALASKHQLNLWGGPIESKLANDVSFKSLYAKMVAAMLAYEAGIDVLE